MSGAHPDGVKPSGNQLMLSGEKAQSNILSRGIGLGNLAIISDELIIQALEMLDTDDLLRLSEASRVAHIFALHEPLWKDLYLDQLADHPRLALRFGRSWTDAARNIAQLKSSSSISPEQQNENVSDSGETVAPANTIHYSGSKYTFFSDALHRPWQCATSRIDPAWLRVDNVKRHRASDLSVEDFVKNFEKPCVPVVLTQGTEGWAANSKWSTYFGADALAGSQAESMEKVLCRVGPLDMTLGEYLKYAEAQHDENPLYLFDCQFCERMPGVLHDFAPPKHFASEPAGQQWDERDLFSLMGQATRPDFKWLIVGGSRSGSKWHVDPNCTHAWNALVEGTKKWILFPPHTTPPGVRPSADGLDVTQPISLMEWFLNFYEGVQDMPPDKRPIEFIARAGDVVFVPCGWWHCVLNLDHTVAVTQNYLSSSNINVALRFLRDRKHLISGVKNHSDKKVLHTRLLESLEQNRPGLVQSFHTNESRIEKSEEQVRKRRKVWENVASKGVGKKTQHQLDSTTDAAAESTAFKFSFF